uniref:EamA domain-containing protein n=2 Tax=Chrysotila carterae TaxID=13221 RepID=A0A7S4ESZ2_CHRCT
MGWLMIVLSCLNGVAISYAGLRVQQLVTATTFMVLTNVNKFIVILFGVVALREALTTFSLCGVILAIGGALLYARARSRLAPTPTPPPSADKEAELKSLLENAKGPQAA